jgi:hypothetical protein
MQGDDGGSSPPTPELDEDVMRIAATCATLLLVLQACSTTGSSADNPYLQPNSLMSGEITRRVEQIPYQHRDELLQNLMWLAQTGEQAIPTLLTGLRHDDAKVRSSCAWVLGRIGDRRTIPNLQSTMNDGEPGVRLECARSLVAMGDIARSKVLIEGLDSDKKEVRYMCHETLKTATGHDFGYDHLNQNPTEMRVSVLRWRQWWTEYSGDVQFAQAYQQQHGLDAQLAAPAGEMQPMPMLDQNQPQPMPEPVPQPAPTGTGGETGSNGSTAPTGNGSAGANSPNGNPPSSPPGSGRPDGN